MGLPELLVQVRHRGGGGQKAAAEVGPDKVDGQAVYNALVNMKDFDAWGTSPPIGYSETRRVGMDSVDIQAVENQKTVSKGYFPLPNL